MARRSFDGAAALVTGAAGGLGRAIALHLASQGARVAAMDIDGSGLQALAAALESQGRTCVPLTCDVSDRRACDEAVRQAVAALGGLDLLVANAGLSHRSPLERTAPEVIRRIMEVNFFGAVHCTQAALPQLLQRRGAVVAVSSVAGFSPLLARTGYAASKHALHGFFDSLRAEVAPRGVGVTLACPAFVATGIEQHALGGDGRPARHARVTVGRQASPEAAARAICDAVSRGRRLVRIGGTAHLAWWLTRVAPGFYERAMARRLRSEMDAPPPA